MCIAIVTTAHPDYPLILLNNRDEFLNRPTDPANWWPDPDEHILGGRDLFRQEHGTWLGITKQGRLACLTNFREKNDETATATGTAGDAAGRAATSTVYGTRSRGAMVNAYLRLPKHDTVSSGEVAERLVSEGTAGVGGFSLMFGSLRRPDWTTTRVAAAAPGANSEHHVADGWDGLAIVSNRSASMKDVKWLCREPGETHALSNSHYGDDTWPKVTLGERLVVEAVRESTEKQESPQELRTRLLHVLNRNSLPPKAADEEWSEYVMQLRNSIFVPVIDTDKQTNSIDEAAHVPSGRPITKPHIDQHMVSSGRYGTQKQSIVMVDWSGKVTYFERTLYDNETHMVATGAGDRLYDFQIENW